MRKQVEESVATGAAAGRGRGGRFSAGRKREVVMRLLRGEDLESVSRAVGITAARASHGRAQFLAAGQAGLKSRATDARDEDHRRLQAKIGELLMETELLYAKVDQLEASGPLARRRSTRCVAPSRSPPVGRMAALLRGSKTDPQRPLPTDPLTTDSVRRRPTKLSHLIEDVTCEDGLRLLPRPTARSKALPDDQLVPEEGVLHTGLLMVARVLLPLSPSSLLHLSDRAVARGRSWSPSRHGGCPGRWNDDRRATRTRSLIDATRVVGRVRREAGDVAFDRVDQIEGRRRVVNMPAGQGVSDDHARSVDAQMKRLPAAYTASAMFHGRPFTFTHSREPGTVDDEMYACARGEAAKCKVEVLTTP